MNSLEAVAFVGEFEGERVCGAVRGPLVAACADCGVSAPVNGSNYTLVACRHGWRLTRRRFLDGSTLVEWRCSDCWSRFTR